MSTNTASAAGRGTNACDTNVKKVRETPASHATATAPVDVVLTGFGPFGGVEDNPSSTLVRELVAAYGSAAEPQPDAAFRVVEHRILDTSVEGAKELAHLQQTAAAFHLHLGVHGGAKQMHVERQAFNKNDFRIPDNNGVQLKGSKIHNDGQGHLCWRQCPHPTPLTHAHVTHGPWPLRLSMKMPIHAHARAHANGKMVV